MCVCLCACERERGRERERGERDRERKDERDEMKESMDGGDRERRAFFPPAAEFLLSLFNF